MDPNTLAWSALLLPLLVAAAILLGLKRWSGTSALLSTASSLLVLLFCLVLARGGEAPVETKTYPWIDLGAALEIGIGLILDGLCRGMTLIDCVIVFHVHIFLHGSMKEYKSTARCFAGLSLFLFSVTGIVLADNFVMTFVVADLGGVSEFLLIGHWY